MAKDFYNALGLARDADQKAIKSAYRKLAREHHPDINPNDKGAEARFKEINEAFQVLSDPEKRKLYDQFGENFDKIPPDYAKYGPPPGSAGQAGGRGPNFGGVNFPGGPQGVNFEEIFGQAARGGGGFPGGVEFRTNQGGAPEGGGFGDVFENLFGNRGGGKTRRRGPQKGQDVEQPVEISLAESVNGTQRHFELVIQDPQTGVGERRDVNVKIPAGVNTGSRVRVGGKGASGTSGGPSGDLFLKISVRPDKFWKRDGNNIKIEVPVSFAEAALGATVSVPTIAGSVNLKIPAGTQCGALFRLSGRGIKTKTGVGDQYVTVKIAVPKNLTEKEDELIRELSKQRNENPRESLPQGL